MTWLIIGGIVLVIIILAVMYNGLVRLNQQSKEAWSDITVQLKRRYDLIPNLISAVKGYAKHEKEVFQKVTEARANALNAQGQGVKETAKAENQFEAALKSIFAVAENYPQLRASENFQKLQDELTDTEDKIMAARRFYNGVVRDFNTKRTVFPTNIFAKMLGFKEDKEFFELDEAEMASVSKPVKAEF
ncbi:MAG: LemA family protein [Candidatus Saccharimonadales bacterium]